jgi:hypothetical protein
MKASRHGYDGDDDRARRDGGELRELAGLLQQGAHINRARPDY